MIRMIGSTMLGIIVTAAFISLLAGGYILFQNVTSGYEFNPRNAALTCMIIGFLGLCYYLGESVKELIGMSKRGK